MIRIVCLQVLFLIVGSGCNSLFYHPDDIEYISPEHTGIEFERLAVPSTGRVVLDAVLFKPLAESNNGLVIHFHGNAQNLSSHLVYTAWLTQYGFHVLTFDYRGYGKSSGEVERQGMVEDGAAILRYVHKDRLLGSMSYVLLGQSLGGAIALPSLVLAEVPVPLVVLDSTFSSYQEIARLKLKQSAFTWPLQWLAYLVISDHYAPIDHISSNVGNWLVIHSKEDQIVPIEAIKDLFYRLPKHKKEFWALPEFGHTVALQPDAGTRATFLQYVCEKLELKPCSPAPYQYFPVL